MPKFNIQLQERLAIVKVQHSEMEEKKRQGIQKLKSQKSEMITKKMEIINMEREKRKIKKQTKSTMLAKAVTPSLPADPKLQQLKEILEAKKQARLRVQQMSQSEPCSRRSYTPSSTFSAAGKIAEKDREFWLELELAKKDFLKTKERLLRPPQNPSQTSKSEKTEAALIA